MKIFRNVFKFLDLYEKQKYHNSTYIFPLEHRYQSLLIHMWENISLPQKESTVLYSFYYFKIAQSYNQSEGPLSSTWVDATSVRKSCRVDDAPPVKTSLLFTVSHPEITLTWHRRRSIQGTSVSSAVVAL